MTHPVDSHGNTIRQGDRVTSPVAWEFGEGIVRGFEDGRVLVCINKGIYACSPDRLTLMPPPIPTDRYGQDITPGSRCWLPWGWGTIATPGSPRSLVEYEDGQRLEAHNRLIEVKA